MEFDHPFVHEIRAQPHDDTPRLIFADYLDEAGDPQGELIRIQVALSRLPPGEPSRLELELRETELLELHAESWLAPLRELGAKGVSSRSFQRGLVEKVTLDAKQFSALSELCRIAPALHTVQFHHVKAELAKIAQLPLPPQITGLDLRANLLAGDEIYSLVRGSWPAVIADLDLQFNKLDRAALRRLTAVPWPALRRLNLAANRLESGSAAEFATAVAAPHLESLSLALNTVPDRSVPVLATARCTRNLRELDLSMCRLTGAAIAQFGAGMLPHLERLALRGNQFSNMDLNQLARSEVLPALRALDLRGTRCLPSEALKARLSAGLLW